MTKTFIIDKRQEPTEEQLREVTGAKNIRGSKMIEAYHLPINDMLPLF